MTSSNPQSSFQEMSNAEGKKGRLRTYPEGEQVTSRTCLALMVPRRTDCVRNFGLLAVRVHSRHTDGLLPRKCFPHLARGDGKNLKYLTTLMISHVCLLQGLQPSRILYRVHWTTPALNWLLDFPATRKRSELH